jgi:hypothetical protein
MPPQLLACRAHYDSVGYRNHIQIGPMIVVDLLEFRVLRQNPSTMSEPPRANKVRDKATQMMASNWCYPRPHRGDPASSSFVSESRLKGFLHTPPCGLASSLLDSPDRDYPGMKPETTWPIFAPTRHMPVSGPTDMYLLMLALTHAR